MNYYEELGVASNATTEEVRQAYRRLARVLHPNGQLDSDLRAAAELQMCRLNGILAVLADAHQRRAYDRTLAAPDHSRSLVSRRPAAAILHLPDASSTMLRFVQKYWFWILMASAIACLASWYVTTGSPAQPALSTGPAAELPVSAHPERARPPSPSSAESRRQTGSELPAPPPVSPSPLPVPIDTQASPTQSLTPAPISPPAPVPNPTPSPVTAKVTSKDPPPGIDRKPPVAPPDSLAGNWFYIRRPSQAGEESLFPPEYIEFFLTEQDGKLAGDYRAKYKINSAPISPNVRFHVQGASTKGTKKTRLTWKSPQGAQGEAELTPNGSDLMNVTWWTTVFAGPSGLSSGTSLLVRQKER